MRTPIKLLVCMRSVKKKMTLISYICNLHGDDAFVLCRPMSLCFLEGPEGGIGIAFGKKPKKVRGEFWNMGFILKIWALCLDPWEWETSKSSHKSSRTRWVLPISPIPKPRVQEERKIFKRREREALAVDRQETRRRFGKLKDYVYNIWCVNKGKFGMLRWLVWEGN